MTNEESEFLFLALERALTTHTAQSQIVRSLIDKLAHKLHPYLAGMLQDRFRRDQSNMETARVFTTLVQAKNQRREALIEYYPLNRAVASHWRIRPYRFVSNPLSDGFYLLCDGTRDGKTYRDLSLKLDRIVNVQLSHEKFEIADQARFQSHFGQAWGVWSSQQEPIRVVLRFEPRHYDRLLESSWHPTQSMRVDTDGYVIYSAKISEPQEMVPWIRSWGSGVVVEEPEVLRRRVIRSLMRQMRHYGLTAGTRTDSDSLLHLLWAKYESKTGDYHVLIYHLIDVAAVAASMWDQVLGLKQKEWLQTQLGLEAEPTRQLLSLLAGLHDIGKATPAFQNKVKTLYAALRAVGLHERSDDTPHGTLSAVILKGWLIDNGVGAMQASQLAAVIGGHHGDWITTRETKYASAGKEKWKRLQGEICDLLKSVLDVSEIALPKDTEGFNTLAVFLSGFVSVCDWIGSNSDYFPLEENHIDLKAYYARSLEQAPTALTELGWLGWRPDGSETAFSVVFPDFKANEFQQKSIELLQGFAAIPRLILVEYLTGGGKTELALHIGDLLVNRFGLSGTYIAMPTQATSNQMFGRVGDFLQKRYLDNNINFQLIHGQAEQNPLFQAIKSQPQREGDESSLTAEDWFQNRKRALLAPYGVGTIDQAMLSVLQAKHHFVRQFGLSHKVIVFDEIHSYDTYMNVIIERLFNWLHALNTPLILLSATLSRHNRSELLKAVGAAADEMPDLRYPRLTVVENDGKVQVHELPLPDTREVVIERIAADENSLLEAILPLYCQGGCIAIVCNTVDESIDLARKMARSSGIEQDDVWLFHARFPPAWRNEIEADVLEAFGKGSGKANRPERAILVATQIIEQNLDLDFDLMVSRTAPIDLLIQRVGRLHRHERPERPSHLAQPILLLREPEMSAEGIPDFGIDEWVYARFFLLKSWLRLRDMTALRTPGDIDDLMDFVYSPDPDIDDISEVYRASLQAAYDNKGLGDANSAFRGAQYVIGAPSNKMLIGHHGAGLPDDEERLVATRDIRPGVDIICITDPQLQRMLERVPSNDDVAILLRHKVSIRNWNVKEALEQLAEHGNWAKKPQLR